MKTNTVCMLIIVLLLALLVQPAYARPSDMPQSEWAEVIRNSGTQQEKNNVSAKVKVVQQEVVEEVIDDLFAQSTIFESSLCSMDQLTGLNADEFWFVHPAVYECMEYAAAIIPNQPGWALYCSVNSYGEIVMFSAPEGQEGLMGYVYCHNLSL